MNCAWMHLAGVLTRIVWCKKTQKADESSFISTPIHPHLSRRRGPVCRLIPFFWDCAWAASWCFNPFSSKWMTELWLYILLEYCIHLGNRTRTPSTNTWVSKWIDEEINVYVAQVVPGRTGGGSFRREEELYSKEIICLWNVRKATDQRYAKIISLLWTSLLPFPGGDVLCFEVKCFDVLMSVAGSGDVVVTSFDAMWWLVLCHITWCHATWLVPSWDARCMKKYNISRSGYLPELHEMRRLPGKVTLQLHQILRLAQKMHSTLLYSIPSWHLFSLGIYSLLASILSWHLFSLDILSLLASILSWHLFSLDIYSLLASILLASIPSWHLFSLGIYSLSLFKTS